jgi:membrane protease YdiL (CAAX protease family)
MENRGSPRYALEALLVIAVMVLPTVALLVWGDRLPSWIASAAALLTLPAAALSAWLLVRRGGGDRAELGLARPPDFRATLLGGVAAGTAVLLIAMLVVTPTVEALFGPWLDPEMLDPLAGNVGALLVNVLLISWLHAALCEEIIFRGFLLQRIERALGAGGSGLGGGRIVQASVFGLAHYTQGLSGVAATTVGGLLWAAVFLLCRRNLWVVVIGHGVMDTILFVLVFLGRHRLLRPD